MKTRYDENLSNISDSEFQKRNSIISELLAPHKTIRDAVHEDIIITKLEEKIIDTKEFQRLRKIKQLGPSYFVYPCTTHTRFEHSLGTLFMAQTLVEYSLKNPFKDLNVPIYVDTPTLTVIYPSSIPPSKSLINNYHILLIRICSLLHDFAHIPFGHTLEDEGFLFKEQWQDEDRMEYFLGKGSKIADIIVKELERKGIDGVTFLSDIKEILKAKDEREILNLRYPFIADIISNTICADLLDYVSRDIYFSGLRENYDRRFLKYFYIGIYKEKPRLILRLVKPATRRLKRDVLSEALHLMRLRYSLAEKIYYHHAKISASAMIIAATTSAIIHNILEKQTLFNIGEEEFLAHLKKDDIGRILIECLEERKLYKPVYKLRYTKPATGDRVAEKKGQLIEEFKNFNHRYERERDLEIMNRLKPGEVIIYCPAKEMGQKAVETLVEWNHYIGPLNLINDERLQEEINSSIIKKHEELWSLYVFVNPELPEEVKMNIASDCVKEIFHLTNEIENEEYCIDRPQYLDRFREAAEMELGTPISSTTHKNIVGRFIKGERPYRIISYDEYISNLKAILSKERK